MRPLEFVGGSPSVARGERCTARSTRGRRTSSFFCPFAQISYSGGDHSWSLATTQTEYSPSGTLTRKALSRGPSMNAEVISDVWR